MPEYCTTVKKMTAQYTELFIGKSLFQLRELGMMRMTPKVKEGILDDRLSIHDPTPQTIFITEGSRQEVSMKL